jgi:hypothetical protein
MPDWLLDVRQGNDPETLFNLRLDQGAAAEDWSFAGIGGEHQWCLCRAGVLRGQRERIGQFVPATPEKDRDRPGGLGGLAQLPDGFFGPGGSGEGPVGLRGVWAGHLPRPGIVATGRDEEISGWLSFRGLGEQEGRGQNKESLHRHYLVSHLLNVIRAMLFQK